METRDPNTAAPNQVRNCLFRWHLAASVVVLPVLLVLAVSGFVILLEPTIERLAYRDLLYVDRVSEPLPLDEQIDAVLGEYPLAFVDAVVPPRDAARSTQVDVTTEDDRSLSVYVEPGSARVLGHIDNDTRIDFVATRIHGTLYLGTWGDYLIEIVAGWALVMVLTGAYLWAPRRWIPGSVRRAFVPRIAAGGRKPWRDAHGIVGIVGAPIVAFLLVSGLPWAGAWSELVWQPVMRAFDAGYEEIDEPTSQPPSATAGLHVTWAMTHAAHPTSTAANGETLSVERVAEIGIDIGMLPGFAIGLPADDIGTYVLSNDWPSRAQDERMVHVDQYSGEVLAEVGWDSTFGSLARATSWAIDAHMGRQLGTANGIVVGSACILVAASCLSAPVVFAKRRRSGSPSIPRRPTNVRLPSSIRATAVALGLMFPLFGATLAIAVLVARFTRPQPRRRSTAAVTPES